MSVKMNKQMNAMQMNLENQLAYDVIDALVQANVDLRTVTLEQAKQLVASAEQARVQRECGSLRLLAE